MNHGITAAARAIRSSALAIGDFIERYIFPGGQLLHLSHVLREMADAGLEALDVENLRPHYARTLWAWSDALESRLAHAAEVAGEKVVRAYRLYSAGSAMSFERGWISAATRCWLGARVATSTTDRCAARSRCSVPARLHVQVG